MMRERASARPGTRVYDYVPDDRHGYTVVRVLPELEGRPWTPVAAAHLRALRPSEVRVTCGGALTLDSRLWRVTVYLSEESFVRGIEQEVEVDLPEGVQHGHDLRERLRAT